MEDKSFYKVHENNLSNISSCFLKLSYAQEQKICDIAEIARDVSDYVISLLSDGLSSYEALSVIGEGMSLGMLPEFSESLNENIRHLELYFKLTDTFDKAVFSTLLLEYLAHKGSVICENGFFMSKPQDETFVYVKNSFSDEAFDVFSQDFQDPRIRYAGSFKEAVRLVNENAVGYCLLPIEERGVRIPTVEELIFRTDSKINSVIPVFGLDGNANLKYALVSKNIIISDYFEDDDRYFEIRIPTDSDSLSSLIVCAEELGVKVFRINTLSFNTEDGDYTYFSVVLKSMGEDFTKLLVFLTLFLPEYIPVGIYKNLE